MNRLRTGVYVAIAALLSGVLATPANALEPGDGFVDIGNGKVWYRVMGNSDKTPILLVHGGPGIPSCYMDGMAELAKDRPVIFYDQLGCGRSGPSPDSSNWTIDYYVAELDTLRQKLGLDEVHLYGHSWGSMLAVEYMRTKPSGVKSLVLAGPSLKIARWVDDADSLLRTLPDSVQAVVHKYEDKKEYEAPQYQAAVMDFYGRYLARRKPWSPSLDSALMLMNPALYLHMCGPSEFSITGTLRDYDASDFLRTITLPTLYVIGDHDEVLPETASYYRGITPGAKLAVIPNAGHLMMHDQPEANAKAIREFLQEVEK